uniref:Chitin-binding type-2 domain-containing protein n=1 Tax=Steinernema glaseri TaxID=37863 RepID=A0A1I7ZIZ6_9BILA
MFILIKRILHNLTFGSTQDLTGGNRPYLPDAPKNATEPGGLQLSTCARPASGATYGLLTRTARAFPTRVGNPLLFLDSPCASGPFGSLFRSLCGLASGWPPWNGCCNTRSRRYYEACGDDLWGTVNHSYVLPVSKSMYFHISCPDSSSNVSMPLKDCLTSQRVVISRHTRRVRISYFSQYNNIF